MVTKTTAEILTSSGDRDGSYEWGTPDPAYDKLNHRFGPFNLDPAATAENAKCKQFFTIEDDGLAQPWDGRVFCNPPYGRELGLWVRKASDEVRIGHAELVLWVDAVVRDAANLNLQVMRAHDPTLPAVEARP